MLARQSSLRKTDSGRRVGVSRRPGFGAEEGRHHEVGALVAVDVAPAQAVNAADGGDGHGLPGIVERAPLHCQQELALVRAVHREFESDRDLGLTVAIKVSRRARDDARRLLAGRHDSFLPCWILIPGACASANGDHVGLLVAVHIGHLDLVGPREIGVDHDAVEFLTVSMAEQDAQPRSRAGRKTSAKYAGLTSGMLVSLLD